MLRQRAEHNLFSRHILGNTARKRCGPAFGACAPCLLSSLQYACIAASSSRQGVSRSAPRKCGAMKRCALLSRKTASCPTHLFIGTLSFPCQILQGDDAVPLWEASLARPVVHRLCNTSCIAASSSRQGIPRSAPRKCGAMKRCALASRKTASCPTHLFIGTLSFPCSMQKNQKEVFHESIARRSSRARAPHGAQR